MSPAFGRGSLASRSPTASVVVADASPRPSRVPISRKNLGLPTGRPEHRARVDRRPILSASREHAERSAPQLIEFWAQSSERVRPCGLRVGGTSSSGNDSSHSIVTHWVPSSFVKSSASPRLSWVPRPTTIRSFTLSRANCSTSGASRRQVGQYGAHIHRRNGFSIGVGPQVPRPAHGKPRIVPTASPRSVTNTPERLLHHRMGILEERSQRFFDRPDLRLSSRTRLVAPIQIQAHAPGVLQ
jgi:hypothetical protein